MSRRGAGEGSIYQRKSDGLWCASISIGPRHKRRRKTIARKKRSDLVKKLAAMQADPEAATAPSDRTAFNAVLDTWLADVVDVDLGEKTRALYRGTAKKHIRPVLGALPVSKITVAHLQHLLGEMARAGVSGRVRQVALTVLKGALKNAETLGQVTKNVAEQVAIPGHKGKDISFHDPAEAHAVCEKAKEKAPWYAGFYRLAYDCGARWGELAGLQWPDLNLKTGRWTVSHNLLEVEVPVVVERNGKKVTERKVQLILKEHQKTDAGRRTLSLSADCVTALIAHRARMVAKGFDVTGGYVFVTEEEGLPLRLSNFTQRIHNPLLKAAKVKRISPHGLRHTLATLLIAGGVDLKTVSKRLGHKDPMTTMRIYQHVLPSQQEAAADRIGEILSKGSL